VGSALAALTDERGRSRRQSDRKSPCASPGGFRCGDYWRLELPLELPVLAVGIPMLLLVWSL
jgi:hypothetical protein